MTLISELIPDVRLECEGCPEPLALRELQESARVLFRKAGVWRTTLDPITTVKSISRYEITTPEDTEISNILYASHNDIEIYAKTILWLNQQNPKWRTSKGKQIRYYTHESKNVIIVTPTPDETKAISLKSRASLSITRKALVLDDDMFDDWHEVIVHGAKARLMRMAGKKWYNPNGSVMYGRLYNSGISSAKMRANKDNTNASIEIKLRRFV